MRKAMKGFGLPLAALVAMLILLAAPQANARVHVGVYLGGPAYSYPYAPPYPTPYAYGYAYPNPGYYAYPPYNYVYPSPGPYYGSYGFSFGLGHNYGYGHDWGHVRGGHEFHGQGRESHRR